MTTILILALIVGYVFLALLLLAAMSVKNAKIEALESVNKRLTEEIKEKDSIIIRLKQEYLG